MNIIRICVLSTIVFISNYSLGQPSDDKKDLENLVTTFLIQVDSKEMHDRFWAEDLIYTSSSGKRFGKETIMEGFKSENTDETNEPSSTYSAEDMQIQLHGKVAVVAFKLVSNNPKDNSKSEFLNSGTFVKRDNKWVVVNWQATKVPVE